MVDEVLDCIPTRFSKAPIFFAVLTAQMRVAVSEIIARVSSSWNLPDSSLRDWESAQEFIQKTSTHWKKDKDASRERERETTVGGKKARWAEHTFGRSPFSASVSLDVDFLFALRRRLLFFSFTKDPRSLVRRQKLKSSITG